MSSCCISFDGEGTTGASSAANCSIPAGQERGVFLDLRVIGGGLKDKIPVGFFSKKAYRGRSVAGATNRARLAGNDALGSAKHCAIGPSCAPKGPKGTPRPGPTGTQPQWLVLYTLLHMGMLPYAWR